MLVLASANILRTWLWWWWCYSADTCCDCRASTAFISPPFAFAFPFNLTFTLCSTTTCLSQGNSYRLKCLALYQPSTTLTHNYGTIPNSLPAPAKALSFIYSSGAQMCYSNSYCLDHSHSQVEGALLQLCNCFKTWQLLELFVTNPHPHTLTHTDTPTHAPPWHP